MNYQQQVDAWIQAHGGYWEDWALLARMAEELGEVAGAMQRMKGLRPRQEDVDLAAEVGDLLFILCAFANAHGIDLDDAFARTLAKYNARDSAAWKERGT
jgi:NTP pyrophosphatase (non-canonical NTP hydrolase)